MIAGADDRVEIAGSASMGSGIAFAGETDTLAIAGTGLDPDFERFGMRDRAFAVARGARGQIFSGAVAARALNVELHASASLRDLTGAVAFRTFAWGFEGALAVALRADILARDVEAHDAAADRRPEGDVHLIFKVGAGLGAFVCRGSAATSAEHGAEDIAEAAASGAAAGTALATCGVVHEIREVESAEIELNAATVSGLWSAALKAARESAAGLSGTGVGFRCSRIDVVGVEAHLIVDLALFGIA